jgi:hypothetical protein
LEVEGAPDRRGPPIREKREKIKKIKGGRGGVLRLRLARLACWAGPVRLLPLFLIISFFYFLPWILVWYLGFKKYLNSKNLNW